MSTWNVFTQTQYTKFRDGPFHTRKEAEAVAREHRQRLRARKLHRGVSIWVEKQPSPVSEPRYDPRPRARGRVRGRLCPVGTSAQTLLFPRKRFTRAEAASWARRHHKRAAKVHTTAKFHRLRQEPTSRFVKGSFRTITLPGGEGIEAVIGCPRRRR